MKRWAKFFDLEIVLICALLLVVLSSLLFADRVDPKHPTQSYTPSQCNPDRIIALGLPAHCQPEPEREA